MSTTPLREEIKKLAAAVPGLLPVLRPLMASGYVPDHIAARIDKLTHRYIRSSAVIVGDIFVSSWGYDQTNVDFYQVIKTTPKTIALRQIAKQVTRKRGEPTEYVMPIANKFQGPTLRKKLKEYNGQPYVSLSSFASAYKWDGKEKGQTGPGYGH